MKRLLALQFCWDDPPGYLGDIMQEHNIPYQIVEADQYPIPDPTEFDAILAMGGFQHVGEDEKYPYMVGVESLIRKAVEVDIPYLGICLGGQLLAHALGAPVKRHSITPLGFFEVQKAARGQDDPLFHNLPDSMQVFHWHEDTFDIPSAAVQLACNAQTENQAFRYGRHAYGTQYHIEVTPEMINAWFHFPEYRQEIVNALGEDAVDNYVRESASLFPLYRQHSRILFENFLKIAGFLT